jgi:hypothetical protein
MEHGFARMTKAAEEFGHKTNHEETLKLRRQCWQKNALRQKDVKAGLDHESTTRPRCLCSNAQPELPALSLVEGSTPVVFLNCRLGTLIDANRTLMRADEEVGHKKTRKVTKIDEAG